MKNSKYKIILIGTGKRKLRRERELRGSGNLKKKWKI